MLGKYKVLCLAGLVSMMSCESLDQNPLKDLSENNFWNTEKDVLFAVTGLYNGWESGSQIFYMDCVSDNSNNDFAHEGYQALGNGTATATNPGNASSRYTYNHIRRANWILENIEKAPISADLKKRLIAEVKTIRAYRYLDLVTLFGDVPLITQTLTIDESFVERTPKAEVYAFLEKELKDAAADLPGVATEKGRMTKGAALGFLTRVYAFQNKHQEVASTTDEIINLGVYELFDNYATLFEEANEGNSEVISDIQYIQNDFGYGSLGIMMPNSIGGWSSIVPLQSLVDSYEAKDGLPIEKSAVYNAAQPYENRDPRLAATILYAGVTYRGQVFNPLGDTNDYPTSADNASNSGYNYKKYIQNPSSYTNVWNVGVNIIVQRYAEILLLNAEAKIEANQIDNSVYENINLVRERAGLPKVDATQYPSQTELRDLVRRELRVELAGEGRRRFDIIRWGIADEVMNGPVYGSLSKGNIDPATGVVTFTNLNDRFFVENRTFEKGKNEYWPIPQAAIDASRGVLKQNNGY
ncbi:RagB/SusD family nutrient uptake outer membrane protein [Sphingobacterium bovistauri]|uniref:RagB/SusD family nutrient uptake outer membrane protein n=1 Tax=Sphingobacterium bovistauri TaxID=2781959 RepID=A0ABS7Z458_9SPHI|nr:RagB/SusD family nutrient uptake outer membrane protein [Sphingobacterium bovistauri]MCA5004971.1 RagB/SusD family nutrient uptake outer membrane protein [Sphingobacterium bovistauri]